MAHTLKLGFKDDPTIGTDDAVDLGNTDPTASGYGLKDYQVGEVYTDEYGHEVRDLNFFLDIFGSSNDVAITRLRNLNRYIEKTRIYLKRYRGNYPVTTNFAWHPGRAATLTFKASAASNKVYWNVTDGKISLSPPILGSELINNRLAVTLTLKVEAAARGAKVILKNLLPMGDFAPPFYDNRNYTNFPTLKGGWSWTGTWIGQAMSSDDNYAEGARYGAGYLYNNSSTADTLTSQAVTDFTTGDTLVPSFSLAESLHTSGSVTARMEIWNGASWSTQQTFATISAVTPWARYNGSAYTVAAGITQARLVVAGPAALRNTKVQGAAIWKNPVGNAAPSEYIAYGGKVGLPYSNIYGVQGDVETPCTIHVENKSSNRQQVVVIGQHSMDTYQDDPLYELDLRAKVAGSSNANSASTGLIWDNLPATLTPTNGFHSYDMATANHLNDPYSSGRVIDQMPRLYRLYLMYALNNSALVTQVTVGIFNEVKVYSISLPQTYTGAVNATAADYRLYDLGNFYFPRPGIAWTETTAQIYLGTYSGLNVTLSGANSANARSSVGGIIAVPVHDAAAYVYFSSQSGFQSSGVGKMNLYSHGSMPRVSYEAIGSGTPEADIANYDINAKDGYLTASPIMLAPAVGSNTGAGPICNRLSVLAMRTRDSTYNRMFTFNAQDSLFVWAEYAPRYLYGFM